MGTIIEMPKLSDTMSVGTLVKWHKKVGDSVLNGDILAEVETDKATMELENFDDGTLLEIFVGEGEEVPVGSPLASVGEPGEKINKPTTTQATSNTPTIKEKKQETPDQETIPKSAPPLEEEKISNESTQFSTPKVCEERILISPLAKKIAVDQNIDVTKIKGSGPNGRIIKKDILSIGKTNTGTTISTPSINDSGVAPKVHSSNILVAKSIPVSKMRSVIASRLLESKNSIPHFYLQKEINSIPLKEARAALNAKLGETTQEHPTKLTLNDIILKACAATITSVPEINTSWGGNEIHFHDSVHLAFGVAVDDGLVTPVVRHAEQLNLEGISQTAKSLIHKARSKKLMPDEMTGSTFTVTNLGMFGIDFFSGIINPPNAAILSVGASIKKPVINSFGQIQVGETMMLGLSCDHRLVDGAIGATFLKKLSDTLENPASMLV